MRFIIKQGKNGRYRFGLYHNGKCVMWSTDIRGEETPGAAAAQAEAIREAFRGHYDGVFTEDGNRWIF